MARNRPQPERIAIPMPPDLIKKIDEYRWANRLPSRAAAIRLLIEIGLQATPK
jgi:metal-responsive CopG/Arc/MetJ family transcriptional regulator